MFSASAPAAPSGSFNNTRPISSFSTHPFQYIQECLDPNSPNYRFRYFFYNTVPGGITAAPVRPSNVSDRLWTQTLNDNPDHTKMAPVLANGFGDLTTRRNWQMDHETAQKSKLAELEQRLALLLTRQDLDVATQLQVIQKQQLKLTLRVVQLMRRVERLRRTGQRMGVTEQQLLGRIQMIAGKLQQTPLAPSNVHNLRVQLQSLVESGRVDPLASARQCVITDHQSMETLHSLLGQQQKGLKALIELINKETRDLEMMRHGFTL